jgi:ribosomal-protein-alanine N-acetyltransferase
MVNFQTERLQIRELTMSYVLDYHEWLSDPQVMKYVNGFEMSKSIENTTQKLSEAIQSASEIPRVMYFLAIVLKESQKLIGSVGGTVIKKGQEGGIMEIGYFLNRKYWKQGFASEATKAFVDYCFMNIDVHKITASCDTEHIQSQKVMLSCGMKKEAELRQSRYQNGVWKDVVSYAIIKDNWKPQ